MCKHIHYMYMYIGMLNVGKKTMAAVLPQNSADSDSGDSDRFHMDITTGLHLRHDCEAAAHTKQLSRPMSKLEEMQKQLEEQLLETSLFVKTLTTLDQLCCQNCFIQYQAKGGSGAC